MIPYGQFAEVPLSSWTLFNIAPLSSHRHTMRAIQNILQEEEFHLINIDTTNETISTWGVLSLSWKSPLAPISQLSPNQTTKRNEREKEMKSEQKTFLVFPDSHASDTRHDAATNEALKERENIYTQVLSLPATLLRGSVQSWGQGSGFRGRMSQGGGLGGVRGGGGRTTGEGKRLSFSFTCFGKKWERMKDLNVFRGAF